MERRKIIIAIDGHSSTGKSTFAKLVAARMGYIYIDTGAIYRAVTLSSIEHKVIGENNAIDLPKLEEMLKNTSVTFRNTGDNGKSETYLNGNNVEKRIRCLEVSNKVSHIAAVPMVREFVDKMLREFGREKGVVMDGRDIGTAVFPNAELKIYMTADPTIRAQRRLEEMRGKGENPTFEDVLQNIKERDYIDEHRQVAPLTKAKDAILLDNSHMTVDEQMEWILKLLENEDRH